MDRPIVTIDGDYRVATFPSGAVLRVLNRPVPPAASPLSSGEFLARFRLAEQIALKQEAATDVGLDILLDNLRIRDSIDLTSDFAAEARDYLLGLAPVGPLTAERIATIFSPGA